MEEYPKIRSVRAMIDLFENHEKNSSARLNRPLSRSFGALSSLERKKTPDDFNNVEKKLETYVRKTRQYRLYSRETHRNFQNDLITILYSLANIDTNLDKELTFRKSQLLQCIKAQFEELNDKLPDIATNSEFTYRPYRAQRPVTFDGTTHQRSPLAIVRTNSTKTVPNSAPTPQIQDLPFQFRPKTEVHRTSSVIEVLPQTGGDANPFKTLDENPRIIPKSPFSETIDMDVKNPDFESETCNGDHLKNVDILRRIFDLERPRFVEQNTVENNMSEDVKEIFYGSDDGKEKENLNVPEFRESIDDQSTIAERGSSVDVDETCSISSEHSVYVDPVNNWAE